VAQFTVKPVMFSEHGRKVKSLLALYSMTSSVSYLFYWWVFNYKSRRRTRLSLL